MIDDIEWNPLAFGLAAFCTLVVGFSSFQSGWGWESFPLGMKITIILGTGPVIYLVASYMIGME